SAASITGRCIGPTCRRAPTPSRSRNRKEPPASDGRPGWATATAPPPQAEALMLDAAIKALAQMASPPFRALLIKSAALAIVLLVVLGIGIDRGLVALIERGGAWVETHAGSGAHTPVSILEWIVAIGAGLGILAGAVFLMPAVTALVASFFVDAIAEEVER